MSAVEGKTRPDILPVSRTAVGALADRLARSGNHLGIEMKVLSEGEMSSKINSKPISRKVAQEMDALRIEMPRVARSRAAEQDGLTFVRRYGSAGLMLSNPESSPESHAVHMGRVAAASPAELQEVARGNARTYVGCIDEEAGLRLDQAVINHPNEFAKRMLDTSGGKTVEGNRAQLVEEFKKLDYNKQRDLSLKDGMVVGLPESRGRIMKSIKRGFVAIEGELKSRGIRVEVTLNGRDNVAQKKASENLVEAANAAPAANRSRRQRDGVSLG